VLFLLILALARPQLGSSTTEIEASGIDILLAVDVSGSMEAMDFTLGGRPANRLEVVKQVVDEFIEQRPNDRIGLLAFAGRPYLVSPLTLDHSWLRKRLESLEIGMIEDGTAIGSAIGSGTNRLRDRKSKSRILILLTDGMNNAGRIPPLIAAEAAETLNIKVYTIGAGTRGEAPMPVTDNIGRRRLIRAKVDIDEETLTKVAEKTGAIYFRATDTASLARIYDEINKMETTTRTIKKFESYRELFLFFVLGALLLLTLELFQSRQKLP
jgi:Ca-activated chloride channel family protein